MKLIENFLRPFSHNKRKRRLKRKISSLFKEEVKKMVRLSPEESRQRSVELLDLLQSIHRETGIADCTTDTQMLQSIHRALSDCEVEERDIQETTLNLFKAYAMNLCDELFYFVELNRETYIDFGETSIIINRAEDVIEDELAQIEEFRRVIGEMNSELQRLRQSKLMLKKKGKDRFFNRLMRVYAFEVVLLGIFQYFGEQKIETTLGYFLVILGGTYMILSKIFKDHLIVGYEEIFKEHEYYEEQYLRKCI